MAKDKKKGVSREPKCNHSLFETAAEMAQELGMSPDCLVEKALSDFRKSDSYKDLAEARARWRKVVDGRPKKIG